MLRAAGVIVGLGMLAALVLTLPVGRQAFVLATTKQPEPFTELYFNNTNNLPKLVQDRVAAHFSYEVVNREGRAASYSAEVTLVENGKSESLGKQKLILLDNQSANETVTFTAAKPHETLELIVALPGQNESIHFWSQS
jgi:uncharacterized membrane protein